MTLGDNVAFHVVTEFSEAHQQFRRLQFGYSDIVKIEHIWDFKMERTTFLHIKHKNDYKYYVIQFLELPNKDINEIVCIPWMWIVSHIRARDLNVVVSYPVENPSDTEKRVKEREKYSKQWKLYQSVVLFATDSYEDAKNFTTERMNKIHSKYNQYSTSNMRLEGHLSSAKVDATTHRTKRSANSNPNKSKPLEFVLSSKNDDRPALKRSKVVELAEAFNSPNENQSSPTVENPSNSSVEPRIIATREFFTEFLTLLRDLHTTPRDASMVDLLRETLIQNAETMRKVAKLNGDTRASLASSTITPNASTSKGTTRKPKIVLPPEHDQNDSRWTLKHRELAPGLVELLPHTSVYINADKLDHCKKFAKDCRSLARMLLLEIFTESALGVCSFTGERAKAYDVEGTAVRPGLDKNARNVLVRFVQEYGKEKHWITVETLSIQNSIRNKMQEVRMKYECLVCS